VAGTLNGKTVIITGGSGMLGRSFVEALSGISVGRVLSLPHAELDVTERARVLALASERPDVIIHCAADVNAERCEKEPERCHAVQVGGTANIIELAELSAAKIFYPQSFLVFDGLQLPINEATHPAPMSVYGRYKLEAENLLLSNHPKNLIVRMAGFFGGEEADKNFVGLFTRKISQLLAQRQSLYQVGDRVWQPTWTLDLARNSVALLDEDKSGIYTMAAKGEASFFDVAAACVEELKLTKHMSIEKVSTAQVARNEKARRPDRAVMENLRLSAEGLDQQRPWRIALSEYLARPYFQSLFERYR
jgi:dTDP-4-dehydrorhamnose reductase